MQVEIPAVEVPGEANPLTEGIMYHVLRAASSADPTQIQSGTKQLQVWQTAKGFYPLLQVREPRRRIEALTNKGQRVFVDRNLPLEVRYLAIIQLKNGIDKYWRKTASKYAHLPAFTILGPMLTGAAVLWIKRTRMLFA